MPVDTPQQPLEDARKLVDASSKGLNADCIFQDWSTERQMAAYRQLNKIQDPNDNIPDLTLDASSGYHLVKRGSNDRYGDYCGTAAKSDAAQHLPAVEFEDSGVWKEFEKMKRETSADRTAREQDRVSHPEVPAKRIEDIATRSLNGDENAKLELREQLDKLMHEPNGEFRNQVLKKLLEDGGKWGGDAPYITMSKDSNGNPESIQFKSTRFGVTTESVPLNKTLEEQAADANAAYIHAMEQYISSVGKFNPVQSERFLNILMGEDPKELNWFMLYRQKQGLPALDRSVATTRPE